MPLSTSTRGLCAASLLALAAQAQAIGITDATGDYVTGFTGSTAGDLDVIGAFVTYNLNTDSFVLSGTMAADIGNTAGGFYVFGLNRGAGTARFAGNGVGGVLFDTVIIFNQNGSGTVNRLAGAGAGSTTLPAGTAAVFGSTIIGAVSGSLLPSNGLAKADYTWNLWPRDPSRSGFAAISDFAPDNSNVGVVVLGAVPEPGSALLLAAGLAGLAWRRRYGFGTRS